LALSLYLRVESLIDKEQVYWGKKTKLGVMIIVDRIKYYFENNAFGVCSALGDKLGVATSSIRLFFIYASCLTLGSPIIIYLSLAFIMNMRAHLRKRSTIWDF
jgi:phage shock protein PspC (stress-responsive transcriptional regulator)